MKNDYPIDSNFLQKAEFFVFAYKNTILISYIQEKSLLFIIFVCGIYTKKTRSLFLGRGS